MPDGRDSAEPSAVELASVEDVPINDEQDEQSASERYDTDGEHSTNTDQRPLTGTSVVEGDSKPRLQSNSHVDSSTVALPPVFQPLPPHFLPEFFATRSHPWNRSGFRYLACGPAEDQQSCETDYPIYYSIETVPPGLVKWSWQDRSSYVYVTKDGLSVTTDRGFRSARANCPIREGRWYFEVSMVRAGGEINQGARSDPEEAHVRVGIARRECGLNAPLGIDGYSYAMRDKTGQKVHLSRPQRYGEPFRSGDVIGILVDLPKMRKPQEDDWADPARIKRKRIPIRYRRQLYFESAEYPVSKEMEDLAESALPSKLKPEPETTMTCKSPSKPKKKSIPGQKQLDKKLSPSKSVPKPPPLRDLPVLKGSKLIFFKNGVCQGVAFKDLLDFLPLRSDTCSQNNGSDDQSNDDPNPELNPNSKSGETLHDDGTLGYFPGVSIYGGGIARLNAGPEFQFAPSESIEALLDEKDHVSDKDESNGGIMVKEEDSNGHGDNLAKVEQSWRPLSELYPIYLAEQRRLDELDAIEIQKQRAESNQPVDLSNKSKSLSKRKRVSSPNLTAVGGTNSTKGKKKGKLALNGENLQPYTFKPSPLGNVEAFEEDETKPHEAPIDGQVTPDPSAGLSILCQVAANGAITSIDTTTDSKSVPEFVGFPTANDPLGAETSVPSNQVSTPQPDAPLNIDSSSSEDKHEKAQTTVNELTTTINLENNEP